jgi:CRP-like cAMP-binding protein
MQAGGWFASLPPALRSGLLAHAESKSLAAGARLFARGDACDGLYCVVRGRVRITGAIATGQEAILAVLEAPHWFGEIALFDRDVRTHDAWIDADATLLRVPRAALDALLAEHPGYWQHFGRLLAQKLRTVFVALEEQLLLPATCRVARKLASMARGYGAWSGPGRHRVSVSQEQLGLMLSLSRQTVNQSLKQLERDGAIRCLRGAIEIVDRDRLDAVGG